MWGMLFNSLDLFLSAICYIMAMATKLTLGSCLQQSRSWLNYILSSYRDVPICENCIVHREIAEMFVDVHSGVSEFGITKVDRVYAIAVQDNVFVRIILGPIRPF
jgi:hypothetical protein